MGIDWNGLRIDYESGREPLKSLAEKYGCHERSIRKKAKKEGWKKRSAGRPGGAACEKEPQALPESHRSFWRGVEKRLARGLETDDLKKGLEELKVAKMAGEVISGMIRSKRLELGFDEAGAQAGADESQDIAVEMARVTAAPGAEETVD